MFASAVTYIAIQGCLLNDVLFIWKYDQWQRQYRRQYSKPSIFDNIFAEIITVASPN